MGGKLTTAASVVRDTLLAVLPPGVPPSFDRIVSARFIGTGRRRIASADLVMFDGSPATVEVWIAGVCTAHRWTSMPGGSAFWDGDAWRRDVEIAEAA
ncbi:hypothetical protein [Phenylobacterium sp.]|uniref:hypothetical protein n=1 Tax=Phenylobacterium sp. TaxID=1871053 RepID=UPI0035AE578E